MTSHSLRDSITGAIFSNEIGSIFREDEDKNVDEIAHRRSRHLSRALSTIQGNLDKAVEIEREMTSRDALTTTSTAQLLQDLQTNPDTGLTSEEAASRLERDGPNELEQDEQVGLLKLFLMQFMNILIILLLAAAVASFALGKTANGVAVIVIVLLNSLIAVYTERSASNALAALASLSQPMAIVLRNGERTEIPTREVVKGDIVLVNTGDVVPADCLLLHSIDLKVNEMPLTGEATDVSKNYLARTSASEEKLTPPNRVFSSTTVTAGSAKSLVVDIGMHTRVGQIATMLGGNDDTSRNCLGVKQQKRTPLQEKLHRLGLRIAIVALIACVVVFVIGVARDYSDPNDDSPAAVQMVLVAVSLAVSAIPEGLPLCVTICLALGTNDMAKNSNALVRRLPAVETLGSAQVICSDKTGTLTEGKMTALKLWSFSESGGREIDITGRGLLPVGEFMEDGKDVLSKGKDLQISTTLLGGILNSTAEIKLLKDPKEPSSGRALNENDISEGFAERAMNQSWVSEGNTSEVPIVVAAAKAGLFKLNATKRHPTVGERAVGKPGPEVPFSSERKMMISVVHTDENGMLGDWAPKGKPTCVGLVKGAPNYIVDTCSSILLPDGTTASLRDDIKSCINDAVDDLSAQALRVLAVAVRPMDKLPYDASADVDVDEKFQMLKQDLVFVGLIASMDPEREGVLDAINIARTAGVRTVMITGDYLQTAVAIGKNIDLMTLNDDPEQVAVDCGALRPLGPGQYLPDKDMDEITSRCVVFARAKPEDKLQIVQSLQRQGMVVSMTGDGVNDAPALNEADIGVAMGITGTEVAKGASDMILLDDNFVTIVAAIGKGRQIYANIQKFVTYLLGTNITQVLTILVSVIVGLPVPLNPLAILFLNLSIDGIPSMSMSVEPADDSLMKSKPRPRLQSLITSRMYKKCFGHAIILSAMCLVSFTTGLDWFIGDVLTDDLNDRNSASTVVCRVRNSDGSYDTVTDDGCVAQGLRLARTMLFITMVFADIMRGMTARTEAPFYKQPFRNKYLIGAICFSTCLACAIILIPGLRDLFDFEGTDLPWWAWLFSFALAFPSLTYDEILKWGFRRTDAKIAEQNRLHDALDTIMLELRQLRNHIVETETKLHVRNTRPTRRFVIQEPAAATRQSSRENDSISAAASGRNIILHRNSQDHSGSLLDVKVE